MGGEGGLIRNPSASRVIKSYFRTLFRKTERFMVNLYWIFFFIDEQPLGVEN